MQFGICDISLIPVRTAPSHQSEQVTQLLLGDSYEITSRQNDWVKIINDSDSYQGWIPTQQATLLPDNQYFELKNESAAITRSLISYAECNNQANDTIVITAGSRLPFYKNATFKVINKIYLYKDNVILHNDKMGLKDEIRKLVQPWLNVPYQWGGKSPLGVDCSGFTQVIFCQLGIKLLRDAYQQAESGEMVNFISEARCGDLAFFDNDDKKIVHTGILLGNDEIIHASGKVRIDKIDHFGIFNSEKNNYSHHLRMIKRYF